MSNKIKLFVVSLLSVASISAFAISSGSKYVNSSTFVDNQVNGVENHHIYFETRHQYFIQNNTSSAYTATVCYTTYTCPLTPNQVKFYSCDQVPVGVGETKTKIRTQGVDVVYPFHGTCMITTFTDIFAEGGQQESNAKGTLAIERDGDKQDKK